MATVAALSASILPPFGGETYRTLGSRVFEQYISVKDYGAVGDNSHNDTTNIQAAIDACFGTSASPNGTNSYLNKMLFFPPGRYKTTAPLVFTQLSGARIGGAGRLVSKINNQTSNSTVFSFNGCEKTCVENMEITGTGTTGTVVDLDWDGTGSVGLKENRFADCFFDTGGIAVRVANSGNGGSDNIFLNCYCIQTPVAGLKVCAASATGNQWIGGNMQNCSQYGIWVAAGGVSMVDSTGFQNGTTNTFDIYVDPAAASPPMRIVGCRSESKNAVSLGGMRAVVDGVTMTGSTNGTWVALSTSGNYSLRSANCLAGQLVTTGGVNVGISRCWFTRNDWISNGGDKTNLVIEIESVVYNDPAARTTIPRQRITNDGTFNYDISAA